MKSLNDLLIDLESKSSIDHYITDDVTEFIESRFSFIEKALVQNNPNAHKELHCCLYRIYIHWFKAPWEKHNLDSSHLYISKIRKRLEKIWDESSKEYYSEYLDLIPDELENYFAWIKQFVLNHESGVSHPLFKFLETEANKDQMIEFIRQESPFDLHFSDILSYLPPGIYGHPRVEIAENFWDESGNGEVGKTHHRLRTDLMKTLNLELKQCYRPEEYCWEQIALANLYFKNVLDRKSIPLVLGAMLGTEMAVPGRMNFVALGLQRVGLKKEELKYVSEHMVVDVLHAQGWQDNVVQPIIEDHPELKNIITQGLLLRLSYAKKVCDRMLLHLKNFL